MSNLRQRAKYMNNYSWFCVWFCRVKKLWSFCNRQHLPPSTNAFENQDLLWCDNDIWYYMSLVACDRIKKVELYGRNLYVLILYDMNDIRINFLFVARCPKGPSHTEKKFMNLVINASFSLIKISYKIILDYITFYLITLLIFIKGLYMSFIILMISKLTAIINEILLLHNHLPLANCYSSYFLKITKMVNSLVVGKRTR